MAEIAKAKRKSTAANADTVSTAPAPTKRQRVSRACDQCRNAREKCDGIQPVCFTCASSNRDCSYTVNPKKRGIQPGYIRTLELALAWVFSNVSGSEQALSAVLSDNGSAGQSILVGKDTDGSYKLHRKWRKSAPCKEIERLLSGGDVTEHGAPQSANERLSADEDEDGTNTGHDAAMLTPSSAGVPIKDACDVQDRSRSNAGGSAQANRSHYILEVGQTATGVESRQDAGLESATSSAVIIGTPQDMFANRAGAAYTTHEPFRDLRYPGPSQISGSAGIHLGAPFTTGSGFVSDSARIPNTSSGQGGTNVKHFAFQEPASATKPSALKLPANLWRLFDVYFAYTHCWFPLAEKHDVLKISYSYPEEGLDITADSFDSGAHAELWSILALASFQEASLGSNEGISDMKASDIYDIARSLIPTEDGSYQIGHVKALLLLSLINMGSTNDDIAWLLVGQAARIAIHLDLDKVETSAAPTSEARRQHVFLGCFVLDTLVSARLGRAPLISRKRIQDIGLLTEEGLEEWQPWVGCQGFGIGQHMKMRSPVHALSIFNRMVRLMIGVHGATFNEAANLSQPVNLGRNAFSSQERQMSQSTVRGFQASPQHRQSASYSFGQSQEGRPDDDSLPTQLLRDIHQEILEERSEERDSLKGTPTPPSLILEIASLCAAQASRILHSNTEGQLIHLLKHYAEAFGVVGMPPIFHTFLTLARSVRFSQSMLDGDWGQLAAFDTAVCGIWERKKTDKVAKEHVPLTLGNLLPTPTSLNISTTQNFSPNLPRQSNPTDQSAMTPTPWQPMPNLNYFAPKVPQLPSDIPNDQPAGYDGAPLERFNSAGSVDLDALFDELASLDGADRQDNQPQFMQNLGFAPNIDLNDFLASDYGQFDPLLSAYAQQSAIGPSVMDQDAPFEEG